jgi:hypothetical protein
MTRKSEQVEKGGTIRKVKQFLALLILEWDWKPEHVIKIVDVHDRSEFASLKTLDYKISICLVAGEGKDTSIMFINCTTPQPKNEKLHERFRVVRVPGWQRIDHIAMVRTVYSAVENDRRETVIVRPKGQANLALIIDDLNRR